MLHILVQFNGFESSGFLQGSLADGSWREILAYIRKFGSWLASAGSLQCRSCRQPLPV